MATRYHWWSYVKWMCRDYPSKQEELSAMRSASPSLDSLPHGGGTSRTTENLALRDFTGTRKREFEAVRAAIQETERRPDGAERMKMITLYHFRQSHTLSGAAAAINVSYDTAVNWNRAFLCRVAAAFGLLDE